MSSFFARRCLVSGRVQGVYYRASTAGRARELGLGGYARNLPDGRVEVLAVGSRAAVESLTQWLWQGSRMASVDLVDCQDVQSVDDKYREGAFFTY
jgi:acylphosphatase